MPRKSVSPGPNSRLNAISLEIVQNSKEISAEINKKLSLIQDTKERKAVLLPKKILKSSQKNFNSKNHIYSCYKNVKTTIVPTTSKIIRYGVEDLERDQLKKQQEKEKMAEKEKILQKMLAKYHEKETKKEVLYLQKKLTRYVMQHQNILFELEHKLINARQSDMQSREELLEEVSYYVRNGKVKKTVIYLLKELFEAMKKVHVIKMLMPSMKQKKFFFDNHL